jgi:hypothetical protein
MDLAKQNDIVDRCHDDLRLVKNTFDSNEELRTMIHQPFISKESKQIKYQPLAHLSELDNLTPEDKDLAKECEEKRMLLIKRIKLLLGYKALIARNGQVPRRPVTAIQMPIIMVGFNNTILGESLSALDGKSVEMRATETPIFYSPMDVFDKLQFPEETLKTLLKETRGLDVCESLVFQE